MRFLYSFVIICSFLSVSGILNAQESVAAGDPVISIRMDVRFDGEYTGYGKDEFTGERPSGESGFVGRYLKILADGKINDKFSYSFRHRLYIDNGDTKSFFNSTDWANVTYRPNRRFSVTAGKQMICIGTIEYDYAPIDVYFASDFWNHVSPFQIGLNVGYSPAEGHQLYAQVTNSPFSKKALENLYAYNVIWYGRLAPAVSTIWSANMIEYEQGHFINYLALGNKIDLGNTEIDLDYMNRYAGKGTAFFEDFSLHGKVSCAVSESVNIFAKGGYDVNRAQDKGASFVYDRYVMPGVELGFYGAGVEYFPIKTAKKSLRLHAFWCSSTANPVPQTFNVGIRWQMKVLER